MTTNLRTKMLCSAALLGLAAGAQGAIITGTGTGASDPFDTLPDGGSGWSSDWQFGGNGGSGGGAVINSTTPLAPGTGSYVSVTGNGSTKAFGINRTYTDAVTYTAEHTISFLVRTDTVGVTTGDGSRAFVAHGTGATTGASAFGLSSSSTWAVYTQDGNFYYFDGDGTGGFGGAATDSGVAYDAGDVYSITVTNRPGTDTATTAATGGEWDLFVENLTDGGTVLNLTGLEYRSTSAGAANIALSAYGTNVTSYDIVPEPGSLALLAMGGLCILRRRQR